MIIAITTIIGTLAVIITLFILVKTSKPLPGLDKCVTCESDDCDNCDRYLEDDIDQNLLRIAEAKPKENKQE